MNTILAWLLSGTDTIKDLIMWAEAHQFAASFIGLLVANLAYKFIPHGGIGNDIYDVLRASFSGVRLETQEKKGPTLKNIAIFALCLTLCASCATIAAFRTDATPKETAIAVCTDLQTTMTAASALVAWTTVYFPNQSALLKEVSTYLELAEESRATACAAVDLVVDSESLASLVTSKQTEIFSLISKINALIAKIKGTSAASVEMEFEGYRLLTSIENTFLVVGLHPRQADLQAAVRLGLPLLMFYPRGLNPSSPDQSPTWWGPS